MPAGEIVVVEGLTQLVVASRRAGRDTRLEVRHALKDVGELVRKDAVRLFTYDARTAAGFKVSVTQTSVSVRQSLRKTTGRRPDFGALQMTKALLPARSANKAGTEAAFDGAVDRIARTFET